MIFQNKDLEAAFKSRSSCVINQEETFKKIDVLKLHTYCSDSLSYSECQNAIYPSETYEETVKKFLESQNITCNNNIGDVDLSKLISSPLVDQQALKLLLKETLLITPRKYVNDVYDFIHHTRLHVKRLESLAPIVLKKYGHLFPDIKPEVMADLLRDHDLEKLSPEFRDVNDKPYYRTIYKEGYAGKLDREIIDDFNKKGDKYIAQVLAKHGLDPKSDVYLKQYKRFELILDFFDRGMSPVTPEEFGRPMAKASNFPALSKEEQAIAKDLENMYERGELKEYNKHQYRRLSMLQKNKLIREVVGEEVKYLAKRKGNAFKKLAYKASMAPLLKTTSNSMSRIISFAFGTFATRALVFTEAMRPGELACGLPGGIDYEKDCKTPIIAFTPSFLKYLSRESEQQSNDFNRHDTCKVIEGNYKQVLNPFEKISCHEDNKSSTFYLKNDDRFRLEMNDTKNVKSIVFDGSTLVESSIYGIAKSAFFKEDGSIDYVCFDNNKRLSCINGDVKDRYDITVVNSFKSIDDFVKSMAVPMISSSSCCDDRFNENIGKNHCKNAKEIKDYNSFQLHHPIALRDPKKKIPFVAPYLETQNAYNIAP